MSVINLLKYSKIDPAWVHPKSVYGVNFLASCAPEDKALTMPMGLQNTPSLVPYAGLIEKQTVIIHLDKQKKITALCDQLTKSSDSLACARWSNDHSSKCDVYLPIPKSHADEVFMAEFYHEILHCQLGNWHN